MPISQIIETLNIIKNSNDMKEYYRINKNPGLLPDEIDAIFKDINNVIDILEILEGVENYGNKNI
ncbi:MAG: hypothetical protein HFJ53_02010 [Clostridia bacterium]|jgi:hypothetical protein|nr:hypothetical protein [Clostridia bacterium]